MKAFIISAILFALLIATVIGNAFYVKKVSEHVISETEKLKNKNYSSDIICDLEKYWNRHRGFVGLSVGHQELDHISQSIISLRSSCESKNLSDAKLYLSILQDAVEEMGRHEEISFENLF
jgi:hypothetical protein